MSLWIPSMILCVYMWYLCIIYAYMCICVSLYVPYTGCPRRNVPDFGRVFLMLKYTVCNPNHLYPKLNGYGDNGQRKVRSSCGSTYCTCSADALRVHCTCPWEWNAVNIVPALVACTELQKCIFCFPAWNIVTCILRMDFATAMHVLLFKNTKGVFPTEGFRLEVYLLVFPRQCVRLAVFQVLLCSLKGRWYERLTHENTFLIWFREVHS